MHAQTHTHIRIYIHTGQSMHVHASFAPFSDTWKQQNHSYIHIHTYRSTLLIHTYMQVGNNKITHTHTHTYIHTYRSIHACSLFLRSIL